MLTACSYPIGGLSRQRQLDRDLWRETPRQRPPGRNMGPETETPLKAARQEVTSYRDLPVNRMTDRQV